MCSHRVLREVLCVRFERQEGRKVESFRRVHSILPTHLWPKRVIPRLVGQQRQRQAAHLLRPDQAVAVGVVLGEQRAGRLVVVRAVDRHAEPHRRRSISRHLAQEGVGVIHRRLLLH